MLTEALDYLIKMECMREIEIRMVNCGFKRFLFKKIESSIIGPFKSFHFFGLIISDNQLNLGVVRTFSWSICCRHSSPDNKTHFCMRMHPLRLL